MEDVFARHGAELSRSTMCGWLKKMAELLRPLYELMNRLVLRSRRLELLSIVVDRLIELGGGLVEAEAVFEDDSLDDIGQQLMAV